VNVGSLVLHNPEKSDTLFVLSATRDFIGLAQER